MTCLPSGRGIAYSAIAQHARCIMAFGVERLNLIISLVDLIARYMYLDFKLYCYLTDGRTDVLMAQL